MRLLLQVQFWMPSAISTTSATRILAGEQAESLPRSLKCKRVAGTLHAHEFTHMTTASESSSEESDYSDEEPQSSCVESDLQDMYESLDFDDDTPAPSKSQLSFDLKMSRSTKKPD